VINAYTNQTFPSCTVTITNKSGITINGTTNELGTVIFIELTTEEASLTLNSGDKSYDIGRCELNFSKPKDESLTLFIYPTAEYEKELLRIEDIKYGGASKDNPTLILSGATLAKCDSNIINAEFIGGIEKMNLFISNNIKYPSESIELGEKGKVFITFVVETDGTISHVQVLKGVSKWIDREARRTIRMMPKWNPADCGGEIIRTRMNFPIQFALK
jgi:TonB family protein